LPLFSQSEHMDRTSDYQSDVLLARGMAHRIANPMSYPSNRQNPNYCGGSSPACSATMCEAYHSGQFSSRLPMRFSYWPWAASARRIASARSLTEAKFMVLDAIRPGKRLVTSCNSQPLPSGSLNETYDR